MKKLILIVVAFALLVLLDLGWFHFTSDFFKGQVSGIVQTNAAGGWSLNLGPAVLVYLLLAVGIITFVLPRAPTVSTAAKYGALFGIVTYGVYDLTNLATLAAWTVPFVVVDMAWGTVLCAIVSAVLAWLSSFSAFARVT